MYSISLHKLTSACVYLLSFRFPQSCVGVYHFITLHFSNVFPVLEVYLCQYFVLFSCLQGHYDPLQSDFESLAGYDSCTPLSATFLQLKALRPPPSTLPVMSSNPQKAFFIPKVQTAFHFPSETLVCQRLKCCF